MKSKGKNYFNILIVVLLTSGLIYAFYNVLNNRIQSREHQKDMETVSDSILKFLGESERMECQTLVYLQVEEERKQDSSQDVNVIHDFKHRRLYISRKDRKEIFEYPEGELCIYSKGISPVYDKVDVKLKSVPKDKWYKYSGEKMYGDQWEKGESDQLSYGYLKNDKFLLKIEEQGEDTMDGKEYTKYKAVIRNLLRKKHSGEESDNEFRKTLSNSGLDATDLKKGYPDVYKMLKSIYNRDTEEMYIWLNEKGEMTRIEKDHTFPYYLEIMKENSEKIEKKVGQYGYPRVICQQNYSYSPTCGTITIPEDFEEL